MNPELGELLLWAITARNKLSLDAFASLWTHVLAGSAADASSLESGYSRGSTLRSLDALGHCETVRESNGGIVAAANPCLSRLPAFGTPRAILTGRRQPRTYALVAEAARRYGGIVRSSPLNVPGRLLPSVIEVEADSEEALASIAGCLGIVWQPTPAALSIVHHLPSLDDQLALLEWTSADEMNWQKAFFNPYLVRISKGRIDSDPALLRYEHPYSRRVHFELSFEGRRAKVDGDWGRFAILRAFGQNVVLYDRQHLLFGVLAGAPFPRLIRRTLTLASGRPARSGTLPRSSLVFPSRVVEVYENVMPFMALKVAQLLGQQIIGNIKLNQIREQPCLSQ